jgi:hypothetical protein
VCFFGLAVCGCDDTLPRLLECPGVVGLIASQIHNGKRGVGKMIRLVKGAQVRSDIWVMILLDQGDRLARAVSVNGGPGGRLERDCIETVCGGAFGWSVAVCLRLRLGRQQAAIVELINKGKCTSHPPAVAHR